MESLFPSTFESNTLVSMTRMILDGTFIIVLLVVIGVIIAIELWKG